MNHVKNNSNENKIRPRPNRTFYFMFMKYYISLHRVLSAIYICIYCFMKNIRNIPKITKSFCKQSFRTMLRDSLVLEVSYGAKTYGIQYMYNSLIST